MSIHSTQKNMVSCYCTRNFLKVFYILPIIGIQSKITKLLISSSKQPSAQYGNYGLQILDEYALQTVNENVALNWDKTCKQATPKVVAHEECLLLPLSCFHVEIRYCFQPCSKIDRNQ